MSVLMVGCQSLPPVLAISAGLDRPHDPDDRHGDAGHGHGHVAQDRSDGPHDCRRAQHEWCAVQKDDRGDLSEGRCPLVREQSHLRSRRGSRAGGGDGDGLRRSRLTCRDGREAELRSRDGIADLPLREVDHGGRRRVDLVDPDDRGDRVGGVRLVGCSVIAVDLADAGGLGRLRVEASDDPKPAGVVVAMLRETVVDAHSVSIDDLADGGVRRRGRCCHDCLRGQCHDRW